MFFLEMPYLRQEIGELFFVLMIMLMVEKELGRNNLLIFYLYFSSLGYWDHTIQWITFLYSSLRLHI